VDVAWPEPGGKAVAILVDGLLLFRDELSGFLLTMDRDGHENDKSESRIYILAEDREIIERRIRTEPARFAAVFG
jgi:hypothetical protein